jgi:hypothetical protein
VNLPFSPDEFFGVFAAYNEAVWPAQIVLYVVGVALAAIARYAPVLAGRAVVPVGLALLWAWTGAVYHLGFFARINPAAYLFGIAFLAQAGIWIAWILRTPGLRFRALDRTAQAAGAGLLAYAFVVYPAFNLQFGHGYPAMPTFGAPCPTVIATLGLLAWARPCPPWWVWLIPVMWAMVGTTAAFAIGVYEDAGLLFAAVLLLVSIYRPERLRGSE